MGIQTEWFQFTDAAQLRDWLNRFKVTDLSAVQFKHGEFNHLTLHFETETLSDGSQVNNIRIDG